MDLLTDAEPANFGDGVVGCSSFYNIPVDVERDTVFDETSDIGTECGPLVLLIQCGYVRIVLVYPGLQWVVCATSIGLPVGHRLWLVSVLVTGAPWQPMPGRTLHVSGEHNCI